MGGWDRRRHVSAWAVMSASGMLISLVSVSVRGGGALAVAPCPPTNVRLGSPAAPPDSAPSVFLKTPAANAALSGASVVLSACAADETRVVGVQFKVDGGNLGAEVLQPPYSITWNTTAVANGSHTLTAVARDTTGHATTSAGVVVTVSNDTTPPVLS